MQFGAAIQVLSDAGVDFVLIGGVSGDLHGSVRITFDLDICYARGAAGREKDLSALPELESLAEAEDLEI